MTTKLETTSQPLKGKLKVSVCFVSPVEAVESRSVKTAYRDIGQQIIKFAEAIKLDPNIIIAHSVVSEDSKDLKACSLNIADATEAGNAANSKLAELQTINAKVAKGQSAVDKPKQSDHEVPGMKDDFDEAPRVQAVDWKTAYAKAENPVPGNTPITPVPVVGSTDDGLKEAILNLFGRVTEKTKTLVSFLVANKDKEVSSNDIAKGSGLTQIEVSSWLAVPAKNIKALESVKRGVYKLDSSKINKK